MPLYDAKCAGCGFEFEALVRTHREIIECPHCHGTADKQPAAPAVQFKGQGWARDGYASPKGNHVSH